MKSIPITRRKSALFVEAGKLKVEQGECICRTSHHDHQIPIQKYCALLIGPGTSITHEFIKKCSNTKCYLIWVSSEGTQVYSAFGTHHQKPKKILTQSRIHDTPALRLKAANALFNLQFKTDVEGIYQTVDALRGREGSEMKKLYQFLADKYNVLWIGRSTSGKWEKQDPLNRAISQVNAWLYGVTEAMILTLGYSPSIGVIHANKPRSFVYDIADTVKPRYFLPFVFRTYRNEGDMTTQNWKSAFVKFTRKNKIPKEIVTNINTCLSVQP